MCIRDSVGSEMCIRDRSEVVGSNPTRVIYVKKGSAYAAEPFLFARVVTLSGLRISLWE
jgi:hypothetical protein